MCLCAQQPATTTTRVPVFRMRHTHSVYCTPSWERDSKIKKQECVCYSSSPGRRRRRRRRKREREKKRGASPSVVASRPAKMCTLFFSLSALLPSFFFFFLRTLCMYIYLLLCSSSKRAALLVFSFVGALFREREKERKKRGARKELNRLSFSLDGHKGISEGGGAAAARRKSPSLVYFYALFRSTYYNIAWCGLERIRLRGWNRLMRDLVLLEKSKDSKSYLFIYFFQIIFIDYSISFYSSKFIESNNF